ncbi:MAG: S8 family serine peptidase [Flavobacteriales bacterium]|nr:S8 family serine peptidase [Flavobacteriales bacterium]
MRRYYLFLLACCLSFVTMGQEAPYVDGEIIIITDGSQPEAIVNEFSSINGVQTQLSIKQTISNDLSTWLLKFDFNQISHEAMLAKIRTSSKIKAAQFNHYIEDRAVPNDPQFGSQWHHIDGSDNDIDTDLAWDVTTGGTTPNGDNIVVCVIETQGANWAHTDLIANHWTNSGEIPNNGVDDDGNGYVDDFDGWNVTNNSDNINPGGHGTAVSGMIGARGNNGNGGAGVNWDVDVMQVQMGGITESNVLAAYAYAFTMRNLYNTSGGTQGAFVVATNASWGIDNGNPANFPAWCAYYNTLGAAGILNCGATANNNVNVDVVGDMPTGCTSDYMIAVTATNSSDQRTFSGFGATSIDLAAPGQAVFLPSGSNSYANATGTSFASPCVAGSIALLYSAPCTNLANLAMSDPQGTADIVRGLILDNVDAVAGLSGEVATGGRLNVNNSMQALLGDCAILGGGVPGCIDGNACNFDPAATIDDGTCCYSNCHSVVAGGGTFDAEISWNIINSAGTIVQSGVAGTIGACLPDDCYTIELLDNFGDGWNGATIDITNELGEVIFTGTLAGGASEVFEFVVGNPSCAGCTDNTACNYNPAAIVDTGDCCFNTCYTVNVGGGIFDSEIGWTIQSYGGDFDYAQGVSVDGAPLCLSDGCFQMVLTDSFGDGWNGATINILQFGDIIFSTTLESGFVATIPFSLGSGCELGCTDEGACNYDPAADINDNSCTYPGCTDVNACNYDPNAGCGGGQCVFDNQCDDCLTAANTGVGFYGPYSPLAWTTETNGGDGFAEISTGFAVVTGNNAGDSNIETQITSTVAVAGDFSFDWNYATDDSPSFDIAYYINGVRVDLTTNVGGLQQEGSVTFSANAGDVIGFGIESTDGCCGRGWVSITNFTWPSDDSCVGGCTDPNACNYDATAGFDDGSCEAAGCTDSFAINFNPTASCDNGTCLFLNQCNEVVNEFGIPSGFFGDYIAGNWLIELGAGNGQIDIDFATMDITGNDNGTSGVLTQATVAAAVTGSYSFNWDYFSEDSGAEYDIGYYINGVRVDLTDNFGDLEQDGSVTFSANAGDVIGFGIESTDGCCGAGHLIITDFQPAFEVFCDPGCTCPWACNYDSVANFDDGSCEFTSCLGCTDPSACNLNSLATLDDGSCAPSGCTDPAAYNYSSQATCDGGTCLYINGCGNVVDGSGNAAGFTTDYMSDNWTIDLGAGDGVISISDDQMVIEGNNNEVEDVLTQASIVVTESGSFSFTWDYVTADGPFFDIAYYINGVRFDLTDVNNGVLQGDVVTFMANAGDVIGFGIDATDGCCGTGWLTITDFTYPGESCVAGCTYADADNYNNAAQVDDGSCVYTESCVGDFDNDGFVNAGDLLVFLAAFGSVCP